MPIKTRTLFWGAVAVSFVILQLLIYSVKQPHAGGGPARWSDAIQHGKVADHFLAGERPSAEAPFAYRIGVPWLASRLSRLTAFPIDTSFQQINIVSLLALIVVTYRLALRFCSPPFATLACILYSLPFHGYARRIYFEPVFVDTTWVLLALVALALMSRPKLTRRVALALCGLSVFATCARETGVLIPLVFLFSEALGHATSIVPPLDRVTNPSARDTKEDATRWVWGIAMLVCSLSAIALTRMISGGTGDYSMLGTVKRMVATNSAWNVGVSASLAFGGPLIGVLVVQRHRLTRIARQCPVLVLYAVLVVVLGWVGGENTVRFLGWASPVVFLAIAAGLEAMIRETREERRRAVKCTRSVIVLLLVAYDVWMQHPFDGYYDDWTAWIRWGGLAFSSADSRKPAAGALALICAAVVTWRITDKRRGRGEAVPRSA